MALRNRRKTGRKSTEDDLPEEVEEKILSLNEKILKQCHDLYMEPDTGLVDIAEGVGAELAVPRKKVTILLLGNHSAGKSTFINWYVEEHVQKTGVAIETQGFTFVTSGRKRESLRGLATLHLYPYLKPLSEIPGVLEYLSTEISPSKEKNFPLLTLVDTPGLVDGDMTYTFDVNRALVWLGGLADLIFVFFDPIGQALCKRTLDIVEKLSVNNADRMRFYLTKSDEAGNEADRQRVLMQIVQELCKRPGLNRAGFDMPTIYIPDETISRKSRCLNQIDSVVEEINRCVNSTVQNTLNALEQDCDLLSGKIDAMLAADKAQCSANTKARVRGFLFGSATLLLFFSILAALFLALPIDPTGGEVGVRVMETLASPILLLWEGFPSYKLQIVAGIAFLLLTLYLVTKFISRTKPTLSRKERRFKEKQKAYLQDEIKATKFALYQDYLENCASEQDF